MMPMQPTQTMVLRQIFPGAESTVSHSLPYQPSTHTVHASRVDNQASLDAPPSAAAPGIPILSLPPKDNLIDLDEFSTSLINNLHDNDHTSNDGFGINALHTNTFTLLHSNDFLLDESIATHEIDVRHKHNHLSITPIADSLARIEHEHSPAPNAKFISHILSDTTLPAPTTPLFDGP
jgi:hypothetical protein